MSSSSVVGETTALAPSRRRTENAKRLDIQGLRALAVCLVVVFHLVPSKLPGGYIGVDVFFVISGFLITGHIVKELERTGRLNVPEFWARRVRRLLPASLLVLAACLLLTLAVMPGITQVQNLQEIAFASVYILNWNLASGAVDYLNATNPTSLVQHYWSLSVEEQFYFFWPLLLAAATFIALRLRSMRSNSVPGPRAVPLSARRAVFIVLAIVFLGSLLFSITETARSQPSAYFITTTRAWEFALGGLVAMLPLRQISDRWHMVISWMALASIVVCAFAFGPATSFPGAIALIPVASTAVLLWLGDSRSWLAPQIISHSRVVQLVGDLSYSIYLWHWPLVIVAFTIFPEAPLWLQAAGVIVSTAVLAALTERWVERPFRRPRGLLQRKGPTFTAMLVGIGLILAAALPTSLSMQQGVTQQQSELQELIRGEADGCVGAQAVYNSCPDPYAYTDSVDPVFAQGDGPWAWFDTEPAASACDSVTVGSWVERSCDFAGPEERVLLVGDSHADHLVSPLQAVSAANGWNLRVETRQACNPFRQDADPSDENAVRCVEWGHEVLARAAADADLDTLIISSRADSGDWSDRAAQVFSSMRDAGISVIVVNDIPNVDGRTVASGGLITGPACVLAAGEVYDACSWQDSLTDQWMIESADQAELHVVDLRSVLCPEGVCHAVVGGLIAYADENHLSGSYALSLTAWLSRELSPLV